LIDLHVHSNSSDGTFSPKELVKYAALKKLSAIALTDHDTVSGLKEALSASPKSGIEVIPGIEMSCVYLGTEIHILGYFIDPDDRDFLNDLDFFRKKRTERNDIILDNFAEDGIFFTEEELTKGNPNTVITRAHFAGALVKKGLAHDIPDAFRKYLAYGGKYCPRKKGITPEHILDMFKRHNVWSSLAHPYQYKFSSKDLETLVIFLKGLGLCGIEVWHSSHHLSDSSRLLSMARVHELIPTGGSDFHGKNKPDIDIGTGFGGMNIPESVLDAMKSDQKVRIANHAGI